MQNVEMATVVELTDGCSKKDRLRLAKERREEKDKSKAVREQALGERQRRAQQQYVRSVEERGRRLEEQRQKEMLRRSAVEEKRRQREEEEKERLEALMRRSVERSLQADHRPKRWTWGGPPGVCEGDPKIAPPCPPASVSLANDPAALLSASKSKNVEDFMIQPESPDSLSRNFSSVTLSNMTEKASSSPHRSPYRASSSRAERKKASASFCGQLEDSRGVATSVKTPQTEKTEKSILQTLIDSPMKKLESPTTPTRSSPACKNPSTPKRSRSCKSRIQSPASPGQYPPSPMRHRATTPCKENKMWEGEEKGSLESKGTSTLEKKTSRTERMPKSASKELGHNAESPVTPTGKAGTTDAEEACRLLAERRRLARVQKEQEEKQRQEEERLRAEELQRQQEEERQWQEEAARVAEEKRQRQEAERCQKEQEDKHQKEQRWKDLQDDLERQREEAVQRVHREAERKSQEREMLKIQEEQERMQRKKRIEEIMKRTRKPDGESKNEEPSTDAPPHISVSPSSLETGGVPSKAMSESPIICFEPLETKGNGADDLSDGVQSMDVSPVSRDELLSVAEYSPVSETLQNSVGSVALGDFLVQVSHPKVSAAPAFGDCNKNLIQDFSSAAIDSSLFHSLRTTSDKLNI
ncbi:LOW QUALITY PROTEIN: MAP7 domain-containing protein 2 [Triplophysa dalaica]|uniref:LOW QUALITY PROTEIN: MAP7 domain-containing protein 2 n=1 Tax=Triplophysa dalaica TaxID=1582913 RepID=UPI0024E02062|nr:LOW QUALITY PROTEIN: MAP7 domain-containing protein 2 [Triplophysa dalaica]